MNSQAQEIERVCRNVLQEVNAAAGGMPNRAVRSSVIRERLLMSNDLWREVTLQLRRHALLCHDGDEANLRLTQSGAIRAQVLRGARTQAA